MDQRTLANVWMQPGRSTRAVIDLNAITQNVGAVRSSLSANTCVMAIVKANAYGHGAIAVARAAIEAGATFLGVATVDEGVQLRDAGLTAPIDILGPADESEIDLAIGHGIELTVGDRAFAEQIAVRADLLGVASPVGVHIKVDTGMHRFGSAPEAACEIARFVDSHRLLRFRGIATHFAQADEEDEQPTADQAALFTRVLDDLIDDGIQAEFAHVANSAASLRSRAYDRGMVRLGIAMYGLNPSATIPIGNGMRAALTLISRIRRVSAIEPGDGVSYGAEYRATGRERIALVPLGYADGYRRGFSNRAWMSVNGSRCPVRGRVCMDQTVIGIPDNVDISPGDSVIVGGASGDETVPALDQLAAIAGTINYEIATGIDRRVARFYVLNGNVVGVEDLFGYRTISSPSINA